MVLRWRMEHGVVTPASVYGRTAQNTTTLAEKDTRARLQEKRVPLFRGNQKDAWNIWAWTSTIDRLRQKMGWSSSLTARRVEEALREDARTWWQMRKAATSRKRIKEYAWITMRAAFEQRYAPRILPKIREEKWDECWDTEEETPREQKHSFSQTGRNARTMEARQDAHQLDHAADVVNRWCELVEQHVRALEAEWQPDGGRMKKGNYVANLRYLQTRTAAVKEYVEHCRRGWSEQGHSTATDRQHHLGEGRRGFDEWCARRRSDDGRTSEDEWYHGSSGEDTTSGTGSQEWTPGRAWRSGSSSEEETGGYGNQRNLDTTTWRNTDQTAQRLSQTTRATSRFYDQLRQSEDRVRRAANAATTLRQKVRNGGERQGSEEQSRISDYIDEGYGRNEIGNEKANERTKASLNRKRSSSFPWTIPDMGKETQSEEEHPEISSKVRPRKLECYRCGQLTTHRARNCGASDEDIAWLKGEGTYKQYVSNADARDVKGLFENSDIKSPAEGQDEPQTVLTD